jgi:hypothetical protein
MRRVLMLLFCASIGLAGLAGCKEAAAPSAGGESIQPSTDITIASVSRYQVTDNSSDTGALYYVISFTYTNKLGRDFAPRIDKFTLEDAVHQRFSGAESGSIQMIGISNDRNVLRVDESRKYTVGFRAPQNFVGVLFYDPT